ncbi:Sex Comb On Midleg-Like Protein 4 [Manis pentadactyla]|nr:Sex Comb On Midleg-Like Protein 4 [Manis pentadactyla]
MGFSCAPPRVRTNPEAAAPRAGEPSLQLETGSRIGGYRGRRRRRQREPHRGPGTGELPPASRSRQMHLQGRHLARLDFTLQGKREMPAWTE